MAHSITVRLNKAAREFQAGENIGFNIRAGVQYYDRQSKQKEWTNYSAAVFAKPERRLTTTETFWLKVESLKSLERISRWMFTRGRTVSLSLSNC